MPVATEGAQKPGLNLDQVGPRGENAIPDHINAQGDPTADVEEQLSKTLLDPTNPPEVRARAATDLGRMGPGAPIAWIALVTASYWDLEECVRRAAKDARTVRIEKVREAMRQPG